MVGWGGLLVLLLSLVYLIAWPVPIDPLPWTPPPAPPLAGDYAPNERLAGVEVLNLEGAGPEDVAIDPQGRVIAGLVDGRIVRLAPDGSGQETLADTGGRPLGLAWDREGRLLVADARRGLLRVNAAGEIEVLSTEHDGRPYKFTDDVDVGASGTVYFTDASDRFGVDEYRLDLFEHRPNGRLLAWDPKDESVRLLVNDLHFANGVAVSPDESSVLVVETGRYRVLRCWLKGDKTGEVEVFAENLPGWPDGISTGDGVYWVALATPRDRFVDEQLLPQPALRRVIVRLPEAVQPAAKRHGFVLGLDPEGRVVANLQDPSPESFSPITSVEQASGYLYCGSLTATAVARLPWPSEAGLAESR